MAHEHLEHRCSSPVACRRVRWAVPQGRLQAATLAEGHEEASKGALVLYSAKQAQDIGMLQ